MYLNKYSNITTTKNSITNNCIRFTINRIRLTRLEFGRSSMHYVYNTHTGSKFS